MSRGAPRRGPDPVASMNRPAPILVIVAVSALSLTVDGQTRRRSAQEPVPAEVECPSTLGVGVATGLVFCDVLTGRDQAGGVIVPLPPHRGPVTLTFDLHNRHTYSEDLVKSGGAYRRYTATVGVLTADNTLLARAVIQSEFRTAADLVDRVGGGAGPGGVKAVAPTGTVPVTVVIPPEEEQASILGEKLSVIRPDATAPDSFTAPGRPIAIVSNIQLAYRRR
jgi:hypothetical protein